jgi:hypothetical protein
MAGAGPVGPTQIDARAEEEMRKKQRELLKAGMREVKGPDKLAVIKDVRQNGGLNKYNLDYLGKFEANIDKIKVYESNDKKMTVLIDLENQRLMEMTFAGPGKTNVERWEVKEKGAKPAESFPAAPVSKIAAPMQGSAVSLTTATPTASSVEQQMEDMMKKKQQDRAAVEKERAASSKKMANILADPEKAYAEAAKGFNEISGMVGEGVNKRIVNHCEGQQASLIPAFFIDSLGGVHRSPLLHVELKEGDKITHRIIDPRTGGKYDAKTYEAALEKYVEKGNLPEGNLYCKTGNYYRSYTLTKSELEYGKEWTARMMGFIGTTSLVTAFSPNAVVQLYSKAAGVFTLPYYMMTGAETIISKVQNGTFSLNDRDTQAAILAMGGPLTVPLKGTAGVAARLLTTTLSPFIAVDWDKVSQIAKSDIPIGEKIMEISSEVGFAAVMLAVQIRQFNITPQERASIQKLGDGVQSKFKSVFGSWVDKGGGKFEQAPLEVKTVVVLPEGGPIKKGVGTLALRGYHDQKTGKVTVSASMAKGLTGIDAPELNATVVHESAHHQSAGKAWYKFNPALGEGYANVVSETVCKEANLPCKLTSYPRETNAFNSLLNKVKAIGGEKAYYEVLTQGPDAARKYIPNIDALCGGNTKAGAVTKNISGL